MKLYFTLILSLIISSSQAQAIRLDDPNSERDYIPIAKPSRSEDTYYFQHPVLTKATIIAKRPKRGDPYDGGDMLDDFLNDLFLTKLINSSNSSTDMTWLVRADINCDDEPLSWGLELFVNGTLEKEKIRTENYDGSVSKTTKKTIHLDWDGETIGVITENEIPISRFALITYPRQDSFFVNNFPKAFGVPAEYAADSAWLMHRSFGLRMVEFALVGEFRDNSITIISNSTTKYVSFFINGVSIGIFQPDSDYLPKELWRKIMPHLLVNTNVSDESLTDWLRLSMISKYLLRTIEKSTYKKF